MCVISEELLTLWHGKVAAIPEQTFIHAEYASAISVCYRDYITILVDSYALNPTQSSHPKLTNHHNLMGCVSHP